MVRVRPHFGHFLPNRSQKVTNTINPMKKTHTAMVVSREHEVPKGRLSRPTTGYLNC